MVKIDYDQTNKKKDVNYRGLRCMYIESINVRLFQPNQIFWVEVLVAVI